MLREAPDFSLVLGGPLYQLLRRAHLTDDALMLQRRRIVVISLVAWLPLLLLSALGGQALDGRAAVPFLMDVDVHVRFLVAMPLLVAAELVVHQRMRAVARTFRERPGIRRRRVRLDAAVESAYRLRNSVSAEVLLIAFVYVVGVTIIWRHYTTLDAATWYATPAADGSSLTSPACGTATSACRCSSSCCAAGTSGSSSGRGCSGRCRASSCTWCRRIRIASAASASWPRRRTRSFRC